MWFNFNITKMFRELREQLDQFLKKHGYGEKERKIAKALRAFSGLVVTAVVLVKAFSIVGVTVFVIVWSIYDVSGYFYKSIKYMIRFCFFPFCCFLVANGVHYFMFDLTGLYVYVLVVVTLVHFTFCVLLHLGCFNIIGKIVNQIIIFVYRIIDIALGNIYPFNFIKFVSWFGLWFSIDLLLLRLRGVEEIFSESIILGRLISISLLFIQCHCIFYLLTSLREYYKRYFLERDDIRYKIQNAINTINYTVSKYKILFHIIILCLYGIYMVVFGGGQIVS